MMLQALDILLEHVDEISSMMGRMMKCIIVVRQRIPRNMFLGLKAQVLVKGLVRLHELRVRSTK